MRIVGGIHRGRPIKAPEGLDVRPTSDRVRQALFNVLEHGSLAINGNPVVDAIVLDAFSGTGALAIEALSRGAASAICMDSNQKVIEQIQENAVSLSEISRIKLVLADATKPPRATTSANLIFMDPPYGLELPKLALTALLAANWIAKDAIVVVETGSNETVNSIDGFIICDQRKYGRTALTFLRAH